MFCLRECAIFRESQIRVNISIVSFNFGVKLLNQRDGRVPRSRRGRLRW
jgi:hypothetical protein